MAGTDPMIEAAKAAGVVNPAMMLANAQDPDKPWVVYGAGGVVDLDSVSAETVAYWRSTGRVAAAEGEMTLPVQITNVVATPGSDIADISWTTNYETDSQVSYGTDTNYGSSSVLQPGLVIDHNVQLTGLTPDTLYHYAVVSNGTTSPDGTFTTTAAAAP